MATARELFAAAALPVVLQQYYKSGGDMPAKHIPTECLEIADAMIAAMKPTAKASDDAPALIPAVLVTPLQAALDRLRQHRKCSLRIIKSIMAHAGQYGSERVVEAIEFCIANDLEVGDICAIVRQKSWQKTDTMIKGSGDASKPPVKDDKYAQFRRDA